MTQKIKEILCIGIIIALAVSLISNFIFKWISSFGPIYDIIFILVSIVLILIALHVLIRERHEVKQRKEHPVPRPPVPYFAHTYPLHKHFTGREKERNELTCWLNENSNPIFAYIAIGGMGKSALARYWLKEDVIKSRIKLDGIIWWSFYDTDATFDMFLTRTLAYVSGEKKDYSECSTREKCEMLFNEFILNKKYLIILDGLHI